MPLVLAAAQPAAAQQAQQVKRIPPFVVDLRGSISPLGHSATTADTFGLTGADLPSRSLGFQADGTVYPLRGRTFAFGVGGEFFLAAASAALKDSSGMPTGPVIHRRLRNLSAQLSLNFGSGDGWSYLTGGFGRVAFDTYGVADPSAAQSSVPWGPQSLTFNFGGGARWFNLERIALSLDMRFYATNPQPATDGFGARERKKVMVLSAGVSLK